jgi:hypothetical protein
MNWQKPRNVRVVDGVLVLDGPDAMTYPLLEAAHDARALRALLDAQSEDELCQFTKNCGLLYPRLENGRTDLFPLDVLRLHRQALVGLSLLAEGLRTGDISGIGRALRQLKTSDEAMHRRVYRTEPNEPLVGDMTDEEARLREIGISAGRLLTARHARRHVTLEKHAADILAGALDVPQRLRASKHRGQWQLEEVLSAYTLEQVIRWSLRTRFRVVHHLLCESCGREAISFRSDRRFCSTECSSRFRVQRHRRNRQRSTGSAQSTSRVRR